MSRHTKGVVVVVATVLLVTVAAVVQGFMWDQVLSEGYSSVASFFGGMVIGGVGYLAGRQWFDSWTSQ